MFSFIKRHKAISALICANIVVVIAAIIVVIINYAKTATVDINVAPSSATITLNGISYKNQESHDILPGSYHVVISMDDMQTKEYDFTIEKDDFVRIWDYLLDSDGGFSYYLTHPEDFTILSQIANPDDAAAQAFITEYNQKAGIIDDLPIKYSAYTDDYAYYSQYSIDFDYSLDNCPKVACLVIKDNTGGNEQAAIAKIREYGYNPDDYQINYQFLPTYTFAERYNESE